MRPKWSVVRQPDGQVSSKFMKLDQLAVLERQRGGRAGEWSAVMEGQETG